MGGGGGGGVKGGREEGRGSKGLQHEGGYDCVTVNMKKVWDRIG